MAPALDEYNFNDGGPSTISSRLFNQRCPNLQVVKILIWVLILFFSRSALLTGRAHKKGVMDIEPSRILQKATYHSYLALVTLKYNIICINLIVSKDYKGLYDVFFQIAGGSFE